MQHDAICTHDGVCVLTILNVVLQYCSIPCMNRLLVGHLLLYGREGVDSRETCGRSSSMAPLGIAQGVKAGGMGAHMCSLHGGVCT